MQRGHEGGVSLQVRTRAVALRDTREPTRTTQAGGQPAWRWGAWGRCLGETGVGCGLCLLDGREGAAALVGVSVVSMKSSVGLGQGETGVVLPSPPGLPLGSGTGTPLLPSCRAELSKPQHPLVGCWGLHRAATHSPAPLPGAPAAPFPQPSGPVPRMVSGLWLQG